MDVTVISALRVEFERVSGEDFATLVQKLMQTDKFFEDNLELHDNYENYDCWLSQDQLAGYAVTPDRELINVFSRLNGQGAQIVQHAIRRYDELHLNCFAGYLEYFYGAHGFEVTDRCPNWEAGQPDVVKMHMSRAASIAIPDIAIAFGQDNRPADEETEQEQTLLQAIARQRRNPGLHGL